MCVRGMQGSGGYGVVYYGMYATEGGAALPAAIKVSVRLSCTQQ